MMKELSINTMQLVPITKEELIELRDELFEIYRLPDSIISRFTVKRRVNDMRKNLVLMKTKIEAVDQLLIATNKKNDKRMREQFRILYSNVYELVIHFNVIVPIIKKKYNNCGSIRTVKMDPVDIYFEGGDSDDYVTRTEYEKSDIGKLLKHRDDVDTKKPKKKSRKNEIAFIERF